MKPFFSIRVEYNPADADDQSHRDGHAVRKPRDKIRKRLRRKPLRKIRSRS